MIHRSNQKVTFELVRNWNIWSAFINQPFAFFSCLILFLSGHLLLFIWFLFFPPQKYKKMWPQICEGKITRRDVSIYSNFPSGCPGRLWILLLWRHSRPAWARSCAACCRWPCFSRGVGLDDPQRSLPTTNILWFCDSAILWFPWKSITKLKVISQVLLV